MDPQLQSQLFQPRSRPQSRAPIQGQSQPPFDVPPRRSSSYSTQISNPPAHPPPPPPPLSAYISNAHRHLVASINGSTTANTSPSSSARSSRSSLHHSPSFTITHSQPHSTARNSVHATATGPHPHPNPFTIPFRTSTRMVSSSSLNTPPSLCTPLIDQRRRSVSGFGPPPSRSSTASSPSLRPSAFPSDRTHSQLGYPVSRQNSARELTSARSMSSLRQRQPDSFIPSPLDPPFRSYTSMSVPVSVSVSVPEPEPVTADPINPPSQTDRLVVGVDFGTTYSAVAVVHTSTPDDIDIIKTWPGGNGITSDKVPTEIGYFDHDPSSPIPPHSNGKAIKWGFQFKPEDSRLRCIKLFLDHNQELPHFVSRDQTTSQLDSLNLSVIDVVTDYLTAIFNHTIETLTRRYGDAFMATTPIEFVLTVPAVWSDAAKAGTLIAAEKAGMGNRHELRLISEPEAAAVYTLRAIQPNHLQVGDSFIVCDAGGGTVDLIAYTVIQLDPLRVEESAVGDGGLCGSAFLNYRFEAQVKVLLGQTRYDTLRQKKPKSWNMGLKYFEEFVKRNYNDSHSNTADEVSVPFPGLADDEDVGLMDGFLTMKHEQIKAIFDPVVSDVIALVQTQVDRIRVKGGEVSGIILVGGFGQSNYLYQQMSQHFQTATEGSKMATNHGSPTNSIASIHTRKRGGGGLSSVPSLSEFPRPPSLQLNGVTAVPTPNSSTNSHIHPPIEVMHPMYAWTAVVRGAVIRGLEGGMVISRKSRYHYGTSYATVYDERVHHEPEEQRYWSRLWERWMISDRMQWHITKGQQLSENVPISFHYTRNFRPGQSLVVTDDLFACVDDDPPDSCAGIVSSGSKKGGVSGEDGDGSANRNRNVATSDSTIKLSIPFNLCTDRRAGGNHVEVSSTIAPDQVSSPHHHHPQSQSNSPSTATSITPEHFQRQPRFPFERSPIPHPSLLPRNTVSPSSSPALSSPPSTFSPQMPTTSTTTTTTATSSPDGLQKITADMGRLRPLSSTTAFIYRNGNGTNGNARPIQPSYTSSPSPQVEHDQQQEIGYCSPKTTASPSPPPAKRIIHVCTLTTDLTAVPKSHFTRLTTTAGVGFDNLDFALNMRVESAGLVFDLTVDGVKYGSVVSEFH